MKSFIISTVLSAGFAAAAVIPRGYSVDALPSATTTASESESNAYTTWGSSQLEEIFTSSTSELSTYAAPEIPSDYTYTSDPSIAYSVWPTSEIEALFTSSDSSVESTNKPAYSTWPSSSIEGIFTSTPSLSASSVPSDYTYTEPSGPVFSTIPMTTSDASTTTPVDEYTATSTDSLSASSVPSDYTYTESSGPVFSTIPMTTSESTSSSAPVYVMTSTVVVNRCPLDS
ncbi:hypothetical protein GGI15_001634 [Coemansia interrupta]|uniref:Uncharacterized protein n=1 Tax=Coemansia interrupta TaxID=1126814 RepID=A0A9W8HNY0_9FUNG|nr:hypothetical protein GGI15_001634 [Coemansia interrupta]